MSEREEQLNSDHTSEPIQNEEVSGNEEVQAAENYEVEATEEIAENELAETEATNEEMVAETTSETEVSLKDTETVNEAKTVADTADEEQIDDSVSHDEQLHNDDEDSDHEHDAALESNSEDGEDDDSDDGKPEEIDFSNHTASELVAFLDQVLKEEKTLLWAPNVIRAKDRYTELFEARRKKALEEFLAVEGNNEIDFLYPLQMSDRNWRELFRKFAIKKKAVRDALIAERENNLKKKLAIIEELKALNEKATESDSFNKLKELQEKFRNIGMVPVGYSDNLYKNYRHLINRFFDQRAVIKEFLDYDRKLNLEAKHEVIKSLNELAELNNLSEMMEGVKKQQDTWKDIGPVPKDELDALMAEYRSANEKITAKKEALLGILDEERANNLKLKEALIEKILELTDDETNKTWVKRNKELAALIEAWKQVGQVPRADIDRIRSQFRDAVKVFNKLKNTFFKEQKREKLNNLDLKIEACQKVEALLKLDDKLSKRTEVIKIQKYWKTIGPTSKQESDEVWKRFRAACDAFFNDLKAADNAKNAEQLENLKKKEELCAQLEAMDKDSADVDAIRPIEDEYRAIGFVPFAEKKKIDKRFNDAISAALSHSVNLGDVDADLEDYKNKLESMLRNTNAAQLLDKERNNLRNHIRKLEDEVNTLETNIQFFSNSRNADKLVGEINNKINKLKADIKTERKKNKLISESEQFIRS
ncbi:MAG: DUF349 domain-containing protein [Bacteroidetes bacterium]|nr:DUF349 domain-containing protein [Bacteroidota bacterium]